MLNSSVPRKKARTNSDVNSGGWNSSHSATTPVTLPNSHREPMTMTQKPPLVDFHQADDNWGTGMRWEDMDHLTRLKFMAPRIQQSGGPPRIEYEFLDHLPTAVKEPLSEKMEAKMKCANDIAVSEVRSFFKREAARTGMTHRRDYSDEDDEDGSRGCYSSDDSFQGQKKSKAFFWRGFLSEEVTVEFVRNLTKLLTFTASFHASGSNVLQFERCYCPCSKKRSGQWLAHLAGRSAMYVLEKINTKSCNKGKGFYSPFALLAHLRQQQREDPLHYGILVYVVELYRHHYGIYDHEALYDVGTPNYFAAVACKMRQLENDIDDLKQKTLRWRTEHDEKQTNLTPEQKNRLERGRHIYDGLKLTGKEKASSISSEQVDRATKHFDSIIQYTKGRYYVPIGLAFKSLEIPQPWTISELFYNWSRNKSDQTYLFLDTGDEDAARKVCRALLNQGEWIFSAAAGTKEIGIDDGGLTRIFLDSVWQQMGSLAVKSNNTWIKLFTVEKCGAILPKPDTVLQYDIKNTFKAVGVQVCDEEGVNKIFMNAQRLYRAFGRLMVHALATKHVLPWNLLPGIYRAYLFCDRKPTDSDYAALALFSHLKELDWSIAIIQDLDVRKTAEESLIDGRKAALNSIIEGLTLYSHNRRNIGCQIDLRWVFGAGDLQLVDSILFTAPSVTADEIIQHLCFVTLHQNMRRDDDLDGTQQQFRDETMPALLRKKEATEGEAFLRAFLRHITGLSYINKGNPTIYIVFESLASGDVTALPEAHTCEQELGIPWGAYEAKLDLLEHYVDLAIAYCSVDGYGITAS